MLAADVDKAGSDMPPAAVYPPGAVVRAKGIREDSLTWAMTLKIYKEHAAFIKYLDHKHLVTSGDASVRPECTSPDYS
jgi:mannan endo-1,4-beta-mannosidase